MRDRNLKQAKRPLILLKLVIALTDHTMLASASKHDASFTIWDVAQGTVLVLRLSNVECHNIHVASFFFLVLFALGVSHSEPFLPCLHIVI